MTWAVLAASTAAWSARQLASLAASAAWKDKVEPAFKKSGLDHELARVYEAAFHGFVEVLRGPFAVDDAMDARLREMFADEGFQASLAELPRGRFESVATDRARELFAGLGLPGAGDAHFDFAWATFGRIFRDQLAQTTHAAKLAEMSRQDRMEGYLAEIAASARPRDESAALAAYRRDVDRLYRLADTRGLFWREKETTGEEIRLAEVFVETLLQRQGPRYDRVLEEADGAERRDDEAYAPVDRREKPRPVADVLARERRLVILGPPGSGKSTLVQRLALTLASDDARRPLGTGLPEETVPILLPLKTYAASLKERSNLPLDVFLKERFGRQLPELDDVLDGDRALVLLDGLDEVFDDVHRRWVSDEVSRLMRLYSRARFVLTSRPHGYQAAPLTGAVPLFEMVPFDDERIRRFFRGWFAALAAQGLDVEPGRTPEQRADALADDVLGRPRIRSLAENPMLCTLIVLVHRSRSGRLPERRVKFYEAAVAVLTEHWERAKHSPKQETKLDFPEPELMIGVLAEVAWKAQTELEGREIPADLFEAWIRDALADDPEWSGKRKNAARDLLRVIRERTGLLVDAGGDRYQFVHLSLQEYLVAFYLLDRLDDAQCCRVVRYFLHAPEWEEILRLAIGAASRNRADAIVRAILDEPTSEWEEISRRDLRFVCRCMEDRPNVSEAVRGDVRSRWLKILEDRSYDDEAGLIGDGVGLGLTPETRAAFEARLTDDNYDVQRTAVEYFAKIGADDKKTRAAFEAHLVDDDRRVRRMAVEYFEKVGTNDEEVRTIFKSLLSTGDKRMRRIAVEYFAKIGADVEETRTAFRSWLTDDDYDVQRIAIVYFEKFGTDDKTQTTLRSLLAAGDDNSRQIAIRYFQKIGADDEEIRATFKSLFTDDDWSMRLAAVKYFTRIRIDDEDTQSAMRMLLGDVNFLIPLDVANYFVRIDADKETSRVLFEGLLADNNSMLRLAAVKYLAGIGAYDEKARSALEARLADNEPSIRAAAVEYFAETGLGNRLAVVLAALASDALMFISKEAKLKISTAIGRHGASDDAILGQVINKWMPGYVSWVFTAAAERRDEIRRESRSLADVLEGTTTPARPVLEPPASPDGPLRMARLVIDDLRVFDHLPLDLNTEEADTAQWTLLLGDNAVGKTTLLRAVALACIEQQTASALLELTGNAAPFVRHGTEKASVTLRTSTGEIRYSITPNATSERLERSGPVLPGAVFAYGSQRGTAFGGPMRDVELRPIDAVGTLFDDNAHLIHAETWLQETSLAAVKGGRARAAFYDALRATLICVLPGVDAIDFDDSAQLWLDGAKIGKSPLASMSDGYVTTVGWIVDLVARWADFSHRRGVELDGDFRDRMTGLVLVDEIDLHLHPLWQTEIVSSLRAQFPKMSFVATTHNPLTLVGAKPGEVHVLRRDAETGRVSVHQQDVPPGTSADDVLTGEWFGLVSTLDMDTQDLLDRHRQMLREGVATDDPDRLELEKTLRRRLGTFPATSLDRMVQTVAAELMEGDFRRKTPEERRKIRRRILEQARKKKAELRP